jgi:signal transduction histidine kinase
VSAIGGVAIDVTDRIKAEEGLKEAAERLRVAARHKDEFLATLAHELRNPLAPIANGLHVLRSLGETDDLKKARIEEIMERQLGHLVRLVDDLLDVARINRGKITLKRETVELSGPIYQAVEMNRHLVEAAGVALRLELVDEPLVVTGDMVRLTQIFANLLNNATKYTRVGGVVDIAARREAREAVVTVADTGVGIPTDMLPHVFELFTQIGERHERSRGLGIGLALVRRLVELHGGSVYAESAGKGQGSVFTVRLPLNE